MFKAVIFDRDGVLLDSEWINVESTRYSFEKFGHTLTKEDSLSIVGRHSSDCIPEIIERNKLDLSFDEVRKLQREKYMELWANRSKPIPHIKQTLRKLKDKGVVLVVATSAGKQSTEEFLKEHSLGQFFVDLTTREDITRKKPDPEIYLTAKEKLNVSSNEVLVVEDTEVGVEAAKKAGLKCVAVPNEYTKHQNFSEADYVVDSLKGILDIVLQGE